MGYSIINFILLCFLLLTIIILYVRQNRLLQLEKRYEQLNKELEDSIASFFMQLQEENEEFLSKIQKLHLNQQEKPIPSNNKVSKKEKFVDQMSEGDQVSKEVPKHQLIQNFQNENPLEESNKPTNILPKSKAIFEYKKMQSHSESDNKEEIVVQADEADEKTLPNSELATIEKINTLIKNGASIEQIAKELEVGVTELELLLKFNPQFKKN